MSLSLYECLRAVGLQRHYARFTSVGICRAAHLSALTMEDYPILGICCMEDRTQLFNLVQMVKTLDLEYENSEEYGADSGDEGYTAADSSFSYVGGEDQEDVYNDENERGAAETGYNYGLPLSSPPAPNKTRPGAQQISVCVRKRPLTRTECRRGETDVLTTPSEECVIIHESKEAVDLTQYILKHRFYFDQVFGEESSNEEVYQRTAYPLVQHMLNGGKATCFAYGQTGAGKTHTMLGSPVRPGLYALAVRDIFAHLSTTHMNSPLLVYVSFFEIYCGQLYDLLDHRKRLFAREDGLKVVHIVGLRDVRVDSVSSLMEVISQGTEVRTQGVSGVNPLSSRSHALLQIQLRDANQQIAGRMWFVDLAGSERASDTKEDRQSRMEGAEINQSLLALKECIRSLDQEQSHTPFRQSKLTQVLKDSFVGDSMTCMIANISPGHLATENTLNTLRYADRVKELKGQGGLRGGRRGKTNHSPKQTLTVAASLTALWMSHPVSELQQNDLSPQPVDNQTAS
ncbi:Kinesin-like protein KIF24 [Dissostichus eleginoides]|uniref:Kinesin-like protein n=1 Tax=Dissostichus eleginoides TaxID=100907 RepID=A0AAD9FBN2_DISEL|nr:Kinesin-like protein KIF24 [Dissostichus eleginoides]